jgi:peptidyl-prolyl cis-trans isomerase A (cyclophilin A)
MAAHAMISLLALFLAAAPAESDKPTQTKFDLQIALAGSPAEKGKGDLYANIHTSMGDLIVRLFEKQAPRTVSNFVGLARGTKEWRDPDTGKWVKRPLYKNVACHRVIPNFMIQCGDPTGRGNGGPGYTFSDEFDPSLKHDKPGMLSMANKGPDTNGSQFFVTEAPAPHLDGHHAIFGEVVKNVDLVSKITRVKTTNDRPDEPVLIKSIDIYRSERAPTEKPQR